ncbi:MAG: S24/S26 family peptidase [Clostridia bacterium]|nr:S24/S26 family peptidase [Clostridia bacterium]
MNELTFEQVIERDGKLVYTTHGFSMWPMLASKGDVVIVEKAPRQLKKYDVALYRTPDRYVLHRVIGRDEKGYIFRGDNNFFKEFGVRETQIVGVLTEFVHKGKKHRTADFGYRLYARLWNFIYPLRFAAHKIKMPLKRLRNRLIWSRTAKK